MGLYHLEKLFNPGSVAVIGASPLTTSIGHAIMRNLLEGGFQGPIVPINPKYTAIENLRCFATIGDVPEPVELAVIATPMATVAGVVRECAQAGVKGAVIISAGGREIGPAGLQIEHEIEAEARKGGMRLVGPNCIGILCPKSRLNASFAARMPYSGKLAFISQSGAVCAAMLDLSLKERMGFSYFISVGSMLDVDFGDLVDYLGDDADVSSILLYVESLTNIRKFMSAAREVSRVKPIVVLKAGRSPAGARAAASHTGALAGEDAVYDAAFRRAGIARVHTLEDFFDCAELLAKQTLPAGARVVVISNSGGPGVMAADAAAEYGLELGSLSKSTLQKLNAMLPPHWSHGNPIDLLGDADATRYAQAVTCCFEQKDMHGMLVILNMRAMLDSGEVARALADCLKARRYPVFAAWMGGRDVEEGIEILNQAGIPTYSTPDRALRAFKYLYNYSRNLDMLQQIPARFQQRLTPNMQHARQMVDLGLQRPTGNLTEVETKTLLACYGIPVNNTQVAASPAEALELARSMGYPVVLKINAPEIQHKTEMGGVRLNLNDDAAVIQAWEGIMARARARKPAIVIDGMTVQPMIQQADVEIMLGARRDPLFGPIVLFGLGGVFAELLGDHALGLVPLNQTLARMLMEETRAFKILQGYRNLPPANLELLEEMIVSLSTLMIDFPEICELDLNPVLIRDGHTWVVDAGARVQPSDLAAPHHLVISPYPRHYESQVTTRRGLELQIRPVKPEDAPLLLDLFEGLSEQSRYYRFFSIKQTLSGKMLIRFSQLDYDRHMALAAFTSSADPESMLGLVQLISDPDHNRAEFSMVVGDTWQGHGIGSILLAKILEVAKDYKIKRVVGMVLPENKPMLALGRKLGFGVTRDLKSGDSVLSIEPCSNETVNTSH